ncbi:MAG: TetR/AcrR family transcriptional regulator [Bacilli bacterium]|nr:TetR/AcrR family transcriptional regulator [Bacilli bacterium]
MPRTAAQNKEIKDKRRNEILESALKCFALIGYKNLRIDSIAKDANCSHGLFYHYFADKQAIFKGLFSSIIQEASCLPPVDEIDVQGGLDSLKLLLNYFKKLEKSPLRNIYIVKIVFDMNYIENLPPQMASWARQFDLFKILQDKISLGQKEGHIINGDPKEIAQCFFFLIDKIFSNKIKGSPVNISEEVLLELFLKHSI